jgi:type IV pilus biogenesis protein CpaD/CtpE
LNSTRGWTHGRVIPGAALIAACALLSGCGGSSPPDPTAKFKQDYRPLHSQLRQTGQAIDAAVLQFGSQTDAQTAVAFHDLFNRWQALLGRIQALKPPGRFSPELNMVIITATSVGAGLNAAETAAVTHTTSEDKQARASVVTALSFVRRADTALAQKLALK